MRKTILTTAAICVFAVTGIYAGDKTESTTVSRIAVIELSDGLNSFCKAIVKGDIDTVRKLISLGEDVNQKSLGMTPAIVAARYNKADILALLIENGANLKVKSDKGYTAKKYAELSNAKEALAVIQTAMES